MNVETNAPVCVNCGRLSAVEVRRDEIFGSGENAVIIENVPTIKCSNCETVYLEPKSSQMIDDICAQPERFVSLKQKPVATIA